MNDPTKPLPNPLSLEEAAGVLHLLREALPLALAQLTTGQMPLFDQWAFWTAFSQLDNLWDGDLVDGLDHPNHAQAVANRGEDMIRLQNHADV